MVHQNLYWDVLRTIDGSQPPPRPHHHNNPQIALNNIDCAPSKATHVYNNNTYFVKPMSFHWNLSSDDDDDDINDDDDHDKGDDINHSSKILRDVPNRATITTPVVSHHGSGDINRYDNQTNDHQNDWNENGDIYQGSAEIYKDDNDDDDDVDWEDAEMSEDDVDDERKPAAIGSTPSSSSSSSLLARQTQPAAVTLRPITIDLDQQSSSPSKANQNGDTTKSKSRKRRNVFRNESLPHNMQSLLHNLHQTHLLSLTGHAIYLSNHYSNPEIMSLAYSLIPERWNVPLQNHTSSSSSSSSNIQKMNANRHHHVPFTPTLQQMRQFVNEWYIPFVHDVQQRRRDQQYVNRRAGAPPLHRNRRRNNHRRGVKHQETTTTSNMDCLGIDTHDPYILLQMFMSYLSPTADDDPQISVESSAVPSILQHPSWKDQLYTGLLIAMVRSMGWRARLVCAMEPLSIDLTVNHPILTSFRHNIFTSVPPPTKKSRKVKLSPVDTTEVKNETPTSFHDHSIGMMWVEILCTNDENKHNNTNKNPYRWFHVDPIHKCIHQPDSVEGLLGQRLQQQQRHVLSYVVSVEHTASCMNDDSTMTQEVESPRLRLTDVTPRYAQSWIASLRKRGMIRSKNCSMEEVVRNSWWTKTLRIMNAMHRPSNSVRESGSVKDPIRLDEIDDTVENTDQVDDHENDELVQAARNEAIPTSKAGFKTHPLYVIPSELGKTEVLHPDAKQRVCGVFKGQLVYRRSDVSTIYTAKKWLYLGRKVRENEIAKPIKSQTKRKKSPTKGFKALRSYGVGATNDGDEERQIELGTIPLDDGTDKLYGIWQTDPWSPAYVGPNDDIPTNEFKNIELALLNPGLVHIDQTGMAGVAKKLGIPYAPCLLGFEGHGGNRTPTVRGIVVHEHNEQLIREAGTEVQSFEAEQACNDRRRFILLQWKRLMVGLLTKDRLEREYGNDGNE